MIELDPTATAEARAAGRADVEVEVVLRRRRRRSWSTSRPGWSCTPAPGNRTGTLVQRPARPLPGDRRPSASPTGPGIVHRLDKGTSGCCWWPARPDGLRRAGRAARRPRGRAARTSRWCGASSTAPAASIDAPIGRSAGEPHAHGGGRATGRPPAPRTRCATRSPTRCRRRCSSAGSRPAAPTRSGCTWPRSATRSSATTPTAAAPGVAPPRPAVPPRRRARLRPPGDRRAPGLRLAASGGAVDRARRART